MMRVLLIIFLFTNILLSSQIQFTKDEKAYINTHSSIKVGSIDSYVPFSFFKNGEKVGFTQDLLQIISEKSGLKFEKVGGTWPIVFSKFKNGEIDIISEFSYKKERLAYTEYSSAYYEIPIGVFTRNDFGEYTGLESLKGKKVGIVKGSYLVNIVKTIPHIDLVLLDSTDKRFFALINNKVDVVLSNAMSLIRTDSLMLSNIKLSGYFIHKDVKKEDLRFGIRKENQVLASIINKSLDSITFSTISELKDKWLFNPYKEYARIALNSDEKSWIENNSIKVGIESAKPYIFYDDEKNDIDGLYADILKIVMKKTGLKVEFVKDSWSNLLKSFKNKHLDLLPATFYSKDRESFGLFSEEYYKVREYIYTKSSNNNSFKNLNNKTIAIVKGYAIINPLKPLCRASSY